MCWDAVLGGKASSSVATSCGACYFGGVGVCVCLRTVWCGGLCYRNLRSCGLPLVLLTLACLVCRPFGAATALHCFWGQHSMNMDMHC